MSRFIMLTADDLATELCTLAVEHIVEVRPWRGAEVVFGTEIRLRGGGGLQLGAHAYDQVLAAMISDKTFEAVKVKESAP